MSDHPTQGKLLFIGGAAGVGKTSVVSRVTELVASRSHANCVVRNTGTYFKNALESIGQPVAGRDEIRHARWKAVESTVAAQIVSEFHIFEEGSENLLFIVDTHFAVSSPLGYMIGLGIKYIEAASASIFDSEITQKMEQYLAAVVLVETDLLSILQRRQVDLDRIRV